MGDHVGEQIVAEDLCLGRSEGLAPGLAVGRGEDHFPCFERHGVAQNALEGGLDRRPAVRGDRRGDAEQDLGKAGAHGRGSSTTRRAGGL